MRLIIFDWLIALTLFGLLGRLVVVQLVNHDYYSVLARENRVKLVALPAPRGAIYDRSGAVLARDGEKVREYLLGAAASSVLGYVGEGDGEISGKDGLELFYNDRLKGKKGGILEETEADGSVLREIGRSEPESGENLTISLDSGLQQKAFSLLAGRRGALVASDPGTGEILALVSSPGFSPVVVEKYLNDPNMPLFNRAIGGVYPPGSTFKIITAAAALEEGKIDESTKIEDTGIVKIGDYSYANWYFTQYGKTEGLLDLTGAFKRSNDIYFYRLGELLGIRQLSEWAKFFGFGSVTGIDLPGEAAGLIPDPDWKERVKKEPWYLGDTLITAIGQGDILTTPLQINLMTGVIAGGGRWCRPHFLGQADCRQLDIHPNTISLIKEGMRQVTKSGGTAFPFFNFPVDVAGKTGTAEFGDPKDRTHAWFTGFAPADSPRIAVTVMLEAAGEGSYEAAPIAKDLLAYWFTRI